MSEMLTEMVPGQEDSSDLELLQVRGPPVVGARGLGVAVRGRPSPRRPAQPHASWDRSEAS